MTTSATPQPPPTHARPLAVTLLIAVTFVWGSTFVLVKTALLQASPLLFNLLRMAIASTALLLFHGRRLRLASRRTWQLGIVAGIFLGAGYQLQTAGLARTTSIKSAFLTGLVVVLVPLLSFARPLRAPSSPRPSTRALAGALIALSGLILLATPPHTPLSGLVSSISRGDLLTLACAVAFAAHLLTLSRSTGLPADQLSTLQIVIATLLMVITLPFGGPLHLRWTSGLVTALLISGLLATAAAFSIQTWAQQQLPASTAALLFTLEPVFALLFSLLFLGERLTLRSGAGTALILLGITATELLSPTPLPPEPI